MGTKERIALTEKQQAIVEEFKNLLKRMEDEKIGIVGELNYFSKWEKNYLYLQLFNKEEVESVEKYCDIDEVEEENEEFVVNENDVEKIELPIMDVIHTGDSLGNECYTVWFTEDV